VLLVEAEYLGVERERFCLIVNHDARQLDAHGQTLTAAPPEECLEEAGDDLFTFLRFPKLQWKALRTTNALERINGEFRRRTKTQASLPGQDAVLLLLFGLLRSG
jgi:hypothetical protein